MAYHYPPTTPTEIGYKLLNSKAFHPFRVTPYSAGLDLFSPTTTTVKAKDSTFIDLHVQFQIPAGYYGKIEAKSSLTFQYGIQTGAGVIDQDYTGSVGVILFNNSVHDYKVTRGDAIAQIIIQPCALPCPVQYQTLPTNYRTFGFGAMDHTVYPRTGRGSGRLINPPEPQVGHAMIPNVEPSYV